MKPHSIQEFVQNNAKTPAERKAIQGWAGRHGYNWNKGTTLPETLVQACPRVKVAELPDGHLKASHIEKLEQNQQIASCCRHPENHEVEALKSHPDEWGPDIYIFHCTCGKKHRFFCVGETDRRPGWKAD